MSTTPPATSTTNKKPVAKTPAAAKRTSVPAIAVTGNRTANPSKLELGDNVRSALDLNQEFLDSISEHGILIPLLVEPGLELGAYKLTDGYRRHAAALQLGLTEVPIFVGKELPDVDRIAAQLAANDQRSSISTADQARGYQKMALFGLTPDQIVKKTARPKAEITAALAVANNPTTIAAAHGRQVDLSMLARIAELTTDPKLTEELTALAEEHPERFDHEYAQKQAALERAARVKELTAELKKAKVPIVDKPATANYSTIPNKHKRIAELIDKKTGKKITLEEHTSCPGHGAYIGGTTYWSNGDAEIQYVCTDPAKYGHRDANRGPAPAPLTDEEKAEKRAERQRKTDWLAASTVRATWIREQLLTRKVLPNGVTELTAKHFIGQLLHPGMGEHYRTACDWLDAPEKDVAGSRIYTANSRLQAYLAKNPTRHEHITAAIILAGMEHVIGTGKGDTKGWNDNRGTVGPYLTQLAKWGYNLADIEQTVIDHDATKAATR